MSNDNRPSNRKNGTGDIGSQIAGQEEESIGNILRLSHSSQRDVLDNWLNHLIRKDSYHIGAGNSRGDGVDADIIAAKLAREGLCQTIDGKLGGRITAAAALSVKADDGTGVDDNSATLLFHYRCGSPAAGV